ncbi:LysM peptidoglycan-binding domain-containing protein [Jeotgalibacillus campisalis]|uniref:LysM domain-containing protein n=1 Tax=Jeotgalibacillus campisalis TaxID=220754 RepID=A0A0C2S259_9BACL|nr:LysM peptidoglycan-binding domain-containing protein [Jeotgalibacillus campisalis]KIL48094.1 hypothetical protein KR50_22610 [Jeotgalibacillus campisalis]
MKRDPYRDQANKTRQEITAADQSIHKENGGETSRLALHGKKRDEKAAQKKPFPLIRVLVALFVLLPVTVAILSLTLNNSESGITNATMDRDSAFQVDRAQLSPADEQPDTGITDSDEREETPEESPSDAETSKDDDAEEINEEKTEASNETEEAVQEAVEEPAEPAAEEPAEQVVEEPAEAETDSTTDVEEEPSSSAVHTVQASETLYRISVNYFGNGDWVEKIKEVNGLSSNEISEGQVLEIPSQ